jgi:hypothetical protein
MGCLVMLQSDMLHIITLRLISLHCTVLYYIVLRCTALQCTVLLCTKLHCTLLYCTALHCPTVHCTALHCTAIHFTVLILACFMPFTTSSDREYAALISIGSDCDSKQRSQYCSLHSNGHYSVLFPFPSISFSRHVLSSPTLHSSIFTL